MYELKQPLSSVLKEVSVGFEGIEIHEVEAAPFFKNGKGLLDLLSKNKMQLVAIYTPGGYVRRRGFGYHYWWRWRQIPRLAKFATSIGCKRLVLGAGGEKGIKNEELVEVANTINKVGKTCNDFGIEATYHQYYPFIQTREQVENIFELTDPDYVHLTLDTGHLTAANCDLLQLIRTYRERINLVHFKDFRDGKYVPFTEGVIDFQAITKQLKSLSYNGWITIDDEIAPLGFSESVKRAKRYVEANLVNI
jgi:inosose dehydratase